MSAETPTTTSVVCTSVPHSAPAIEANPVARPWLSVRETNRVMSGPGVIARITVAMANMFDNELRDIELDAASLELAAYAAFGSMASATDWWLGTDQDSPRRMSTDEFVAQLTTIMVGAISGTCELLGIKLNPDLPLHEGVRRSEHVA